MMQRIGLLSYRKYYGSKISKIVIVRSKISEIPPNLHREDASLAATAFYLREEKDDNKVVLEDKDLEIIGSPLIKYGDSTVIVQHVETGLWLSYRVCGQFQLVIAQLTCGIIKHFHVTSGKPTKF